MTMTEDTTSSSRSVWKRRLLFCGLFFVASPLALRLPIVSNALKDLALVTISETTPYTVSVDNCIIRPLLLGVQLDAVTIEDEYGPVANISSVFVGVKLPFDGQFVRSIIVDTPEIFFSMDNLAQEDSSVESQLLIPDLPRIQIRSAYIHIQNGSQHFVLPDLNLTHKDGTAHIWAEESFKLEMDTQTILFSPFQWNDIQIANGGIRLSDVNLESSMGNLYGEFGVDNSEIFGNLEGVLDLALAIRHPKWTGDGFVRYQMSPTGFGDGFNVGVQLNADAFSMTRQASTRLFHYSMDSLTSNLLWKDNTLFIEDMDVGWGDGHSLISGFIHPSDNRVRLDIEGVRQNLWSVGRDLDLSPAPWVEMKSDSIVVLEGDLQPLSLSGTIDIQGTDFRNASGNVRVKKTTLALAELNMSGALQLTKTHLSYQLSSVEMKSDTGQTGIGKIDGVFGFKAPNETDINFEFSPLDLRVLRPVGGSQFTGVAHGGGVVRGPMKQLSIESQYTIHDFGMMGMSYADTLNIEIDGDTLKELEVTIHDAQKGESHLQGNMDVRFAKELWIDGKFVAQSARANNLMSIFFEPLDVDADTTGSISIRGYSSNLKIVADLGLTNVEMWGEPFDTGRFRLSQDKDNLTIEEFSVERNDGLGSAWMRGTRSNGNNNFEVLVGGLPVEYLTWILDGKYPVRGKVDFFGTIRGETFIPSGTLRIRDFWHGTQSLGSANLLLHPQPEGLVVQGTVADGIEVQGLTGFSLTDDFAFDVDVVDFPIQSLYTMSFGDDRVSGIVSTDGQVWQRNGELGGDIELTKVEFGWTDRWLQLKEPTSLRWDGVYANMDPITIVGSGKTNLDISAERKGHQHSVQAYGTMDMAVVEMVLEGTERSSGLGKVNGVWTESGLDVQLNIENGFLQGSWFPHPIESIQATLNMENQTLELLEWESIVGGGTVRLDGTVLTKDFIPDSYDLTVDMMQSRIQLLDWLPPVLGTGSFRVTGESELPLITGAVDVDEMTFVDRIGWEGALITFAPAAITGSAEEGAEPYFEYDIDFTANKTIRMRNNLADMTASADLKFVGDMATPGMTGRIDLTENGRVLFKERDFNVLRGSLRYDDPLTFDPLLDIALETSVITPEREVDIKYYITGLYSDWQTHTTSTPSLPQADINALLLFGMTRRELETEGGLGAALAIEGSDLVVSKFGSSQRFVEVGNGIFQSEVLRLDRVDIVSGPTDRNSAYVSSALRLLAEKDIGDGTLRLEQNITDTTDVFVSWEQRLSERLYTRLYWASQQQGRSINGNGAVGAEFEVQWELE